jgi:hypothetical protein
MIIDYDLSRLTDADLRAASLAASDLAAFGVSRPSPALERVARSIRDCLVAEEAARSGGRGRGAVNLSVQDFADGDPSDRRITLRYLGTVRDDRTEPPAVRELFASVMADLADPTETARQVELAGLDRMAGNVVVE